MMRSCLRRAQSVPWAISTDQPEVIGDLPPSMVPTQGIRPRFGAVGQHGSMAVVERLIRAMKDEATRRIVVPQRQADFRRELTSFFA